MKIKKFCWYKMKCFSVLPGVIVTPEHKGFRVAIRFLNRHVGVWLTFESQVNSTEPDEHSWSFSC